LIVRQTLRVWLSHVLAITVLAAAVAPPSFQHAHVDGDAPHDHEHGHSHVRIHDQGHRHQESVTAAQIAHVHWSFLMFDLTWPAPLEDPSQPVGGSDSEAPFVAGRPVKSAIADVRDASPRWDLANQAALVPIECPAAKVAGKPPDLPSSGNLLCDTARHERSGAQLF
jgi:hypothetical protein